MNLQRSDNQLHSPLHTTITTFPVADFTIPSPDPRQSSEREDGPHVFEIGTVWTIYRDFQKIAQFGEKIADLIAVC